MAQETTLACNRTPFLSDDECDRGDVDIQAFSNLPICQLIDPTEPEIAIHPYDFPLIPFQPPACSCINIDITSKSGVSNRDKPYFDVDFKAIGDCCEGNYKATVNMDIPCLPFNISGGDKDYAVNIETYCDSSKEPQGTFNLGLIKTDDCSLSISPKLKLNIPKPKDIEFEDAEITIREEDCNTIPSGRGGVYPVSAPNCMVRFKPKLLLTLRKPPELEVCTPKITMSGGLGSQSTGEFTGVSQPESCKYKICPELNLSIPCPIDDEDIKVETKPKWVDGKVSYKKYTVLKKDDPCKYTKPDKFEFDIQCPLPDSDFQVTAKPKWTDASANYKKYTILKKEDECRFTTPNNIDFEIRCPLPTYDDFKIKIIPKWVQYKQNYKDYIILKRDGSGDDICRFKTPNNIDFEIRCPLPDEDFKIEIKPVFSCKKTLDFKEYTILKRDTTCRFVKANRFNLTLPCLLKFITLKDSVSGTVIEPTYCKDKEDCSITWKLNMCWCIKYIGTDGSYGIVSNCCDKKGYNYCRQVADPYCGCLNPYVANCGCQVVKFEPLSSCSNLIVHVEQKEHCNVLIKIGMYYI